MRKFLFLILFQVPIIIFGQLPTNDKNWNSTPILYDEFTGTRYWNNNRVDNTYKWIAYFSESGIKHDSTDIYCNHYYEHQIYQRENAIFSTSSPGYMILRADYKPNTTNYWYPGPPYSPVTCPYDYISGAIESIQSFKYGYFEIKCALPNKNYGNFPAFWLWSGINRYNEIDIFEHTIHGEANEERRFTGTYYTSNKVAVQKVNYFVPSNEPGLTSFHTYAIEWSPKVIIWYFDGKQVGQAINEPEITDQPMKLKVNYALNDYITLADTNLFPLEMKIDYVKVYNLKCDCNSIVSITNSADLNNFNYSVKKKITIGYAGSTIKVQGGSVSLRATDEIIINGDFEVPIGSEFFAFTHSCPQ